MGVTPFLPTSSLTTAFLSHFGQRRTVTHNVRRLHHQETHRRQGQKHTHFLSCAIPPSFQDSLFSPQALSLSLEALRYCFLPFRWHVRANFCFQAASPLFSRLYFSFLRHLWSTLRRIALLRLHSGCSPSCFTVPISSHSFLFPSVCVTSLRLVRCHSCLSVCAGFVRTISSLFPSSPCFLRRESLRV